MRDVIVINQEALCSSIRPVAQLSRHRILGEDPSIRPIEIGDELVPLWTNQSAVFNEDVLLNHPSSLANLIMGLYPAIGSNQS